MGAHVGIWNTLKFYLPAQQGENSQRHVPQKYSIPLKQYPPKACPSRFCIALCVFNISFLCLIIKYELATILKFVE